jgi:hypothetical protein
VHQVRSTRSSRRYLQYQHPQHQHHHHHSDEHVAALHSFALRSLLTLPIREVQRKGLLDNLAIVQSPMWNAGSLGVQLQERLVQRGQTHVQCTLLLHKVASSHNELLALIGFEHSSDNVGEQASTLVAVPCKRLLARLGCALDFPSTIVTQQIQQEL